MQKFQVFVSSTFEDLRHERDTVVRAILEMGHIPVGMEMFSAANDEQWKIITRHIDQSDYYVVLIAHRYGSTLPDGQSFTFREYEYATSQSVPVLGFIIDQSAEWPVDRVDTEPSAVAGLAEFKRRVKEKPVDFWVSAADLHGKCAVALMKAFTANPREGWVRANEVAGPAVMAELTRLSAENAQLRKQLQAAEAESRADYEGRLEELVQTMMANKRRFSFRRTQLGQWERSEEVSLFRIFREIGPTMITENSLDDLRTTLAMMASGKFPWHQAASNQASQILADLMALEVVEPSNRKHSVTDNNEYWSLSQLGRDLLRWILRILLKASEAKKNEEPDAPESPA